ncbi:nickel-dependent hydrogenase large subunit [Magnetovirga frankeli]|uniref:nickel-dependent hydrogenase large subunit n=1 Tax=Magnetovirga frankeli TaxID=947516 RepID=UPI003D33292C
MSHWISAASPRTTASPIYTDKPDAGRAPGSRAALTPISEAGYKREHAKPDGKYSWSRAPRYGGEVMEVGPAARVINTYRAGVNPSLNALVDSTCREIGIGLEQLVSVLGRHTSRWILAKLTLDTLRRDIQRVKADELAFVERDIPKNASGVGLTEATRGALGHWIETDDKGLIRRYEMVVPTTWNLSPRDAAGRPGAVEQMLIGTRIADPENPMELARIVRSSDPCMACSVH